MKKRPYLKIIREGNHVAEIEIMLIDTDFDWSPCISLEDATRLDEMREALRRGDIELASRYGKVYTLKAVEKND